MKDKLFLDTNVVIDLLGEREVFYNSIAKIATSKSTTISTGELYRFKARIVKSASKTITQK